MQNNTSFKSALRPSAFPRIQARVLTTTLLAAALAVGCGDSTDEGPGLPGTGISPVQPGATDSGVAPGVTPVTPGITPVTPGVTPVTTTDAGVAAAPSTGGSVDTQWCKVKKILDAKCVACHTTPLAAGAPFPLAKYEDLVAAHPSKAGKKVYERTHDKP